MNPYTGELFEGPAAIAAAQMRREPVVEVSEKVATLIRDGQAAQARKARRCAREKAARASRRRARH